MSVPAVQEDDVQGARGKLEEQGVKKKKERRRRKRKKKSFIRIVIVDCLQEHGG